MNILHVMHVDPANYPPIINSCRVQARRGHKVCLIGFYRGLRHNFAMGSHIDEHYVNDISGGYPTSLAGKIEGYLLFRKQVKALVETSAPDIVVAHEFHGLWGVLPLIRKIPVIFHVHDYPNPHFLKGIGYLDRMLFFSCKSAINKLTAMIMPEENRLRIAISELKFAKQTFVVPNCPLRYRAVRTTVLRDFIQARTGTIPERVIVRAGGSGPVHMVDESVQSLRFLPETYHLCLIGCGDVRYKRKLAEMAEEWGVGKRVHQLSYVGYDDLHCYLESADVGLALYSEAPNDINTRFPASGKLMEYLAAGIPAVIGGMPGYKPQQKEMAGAVPITDPTPKGIASAIRIAVADPADLERLCRSSREVHENIFNYETCYGPVLDWMEQMAASWKR